LAREKLDVVTVVSQEGVDLDLDLEEEEDERAAKGERGVGRFPVLLFFFPGVAACKRHKRTGPPWLFPLSFLFLSLAAE
jgi:hypothetical protein